MERTKVNKKPDLILCADFHLRDTNPVCRTDNFISAQTKKLNYISDLQFKYDCPVLHTGDLWDTWKPSPFMITYAIKYLPKVFWTILGNHDLPQHSLELIDKCGVNTLAEAGRIKIIKGCHWGEVPDEKSTIEIKGRSILVWHIMAYQGKKPWPDCTDPLAAGLLRKYPDWDLITLGHNHKTFHEEHEGRLLVNPGSLMRMDADQINHKPCVYLWFAEDNTVQKVFLPIEDNVISREHIERKEERDNRIDAFVSRLDGDWEAAMSFEDNLEAFFKANSIRESVKEIIYKSLE